MTDSGRLDRWLLRPLAFFLCAFSRKTFFLQGSKGDPPSGAPSRLCLLKFSGLGSVINTLPLLQAIRHQCPHASILYLSWESNRELVTRVRGVDRFVGIDPRSVRSFCRTLLGALRTVQQFSPDCSIDLQVYKTTAFTTLVTRVSGARRTLSFIRPGQGFRKGLLGHTVPFDDTLPLQESFARLGTKAGIHRTPRPHPPLPVTDRDREELALRGLPGGIGSRLLVVNPNASSFCLERRWPLLFFAEASAILLSLFPDLTIILTGSAQETEYVGRLERCLNRGDRVRNMAGLLSLGGLMALLDRCDLFLTNDSGPMHLGFLAGTPTVALFGPARPDNHSIHARNDRTVLLYKRLSCSPCVHQSDAPPCQGHNLCMQQISPAEVVRACVSLLERSSHPHQKPHPPTPLPVAIPFRRSADRPVHGQSQGPGSR